jgi:ABC-type transport system involved in multi-copper enzyme maturation permease subunit
VTLLDSPALAQAHGTGTTPIRLIRAEIMKVRSTNTWWLFLLGIVVFTALALWSNGVSHHYQLYPQLNTMSAASRDQALAGAAHARTPAGRAALASNMMTSGQFVGVLFAMVIGILVITNEFAHQTAAATFLTTPHRAVVVMAKLAAAACFGALFWLASTIINLGVTPVYLHSQRISVSLTGWIVIRSVSLNLLAFVIWAVFGLGLGAVIRSQLGSVLAGLAIYLVGFAAVELIFHLIYNFYRHGWVLGAPVIAPAVASLVMITPGRAFPHAPPQWAGLAVMAGYALVFAVIGIVVTCRRDVT